MALVSFEFSGFCNDERKSGGDVSGDRFRNRFNFLLRYECKIIMVKLLADFLLSVLFNHTI